MRVEMQGRAVVDANGRLAACTARVEVGVIVSSPATSQSHSERYRAQGKLTVTYSPNKQLYAAAMPLVQLVNSASRKEATSCSAPFRFPQRRRHLVHSPRAVISGGDQCTPHHIAFYKHGTEACPQVDATCRLLFYWLRVTSMFPQAAHSQEPMCPPALSGANLTLLDNVATDSKNIPTCCWLS